MNLETFKENLKKQNSNPDNPKKIRIVTSYLCGQCEFEFKYSEILFGIKNNFVQIVSKEENSIIEFNIDHIIMLVNFYE